MTEADRPEGIRRLFALGCAAAGVALASGVRWALNPVLRDQHPFLLFFPVIVAVSWYFGRNAGFLATALAVPPGLWFLDIWRSPREGAALYALAIGFFILVATGLSVAVGAMRRTGEDLQNALERSERATRAARESQDRSRQLAAIVESNEDAIVAKDLEGRIIEWNLSAERLFGYRREEVLGRSIQILMPPDAIDDWRHILKRVVNGERVEHFETRRRARDGRILDVSLTVSPLRDEGGRIVGASKTARDVTAEKAARLERDRTRELLLGVLGHDLRSPLNAIQISLYTLSRHASETDKPALSRISSSAERMSRMIDQILDLTKSRLGGGIPVHTQAADLAAICRTVADEFEALHPGRLRLSGEGDLRGVWDADRISQVLSNLLSNAFKYGHPGEPILLTATSAEESVVAEVTNQGAAIPQPHLETIFEPFKRGGETGKRREIAGLGLGLYIAREIVKAHGGKLSVRSSSDEGTTFTVSLPRSAPSTP